ncbi:Septum formation initiator [Halanaerobium congolense]|jgi:cell division protein FtsL|uniref:Cell division protein FtsL n=1 Tax=Halanaerobium congolense TaxID=54121 RepID=A0A1G6SEP5_9FIRM|nr:septum formation initiator family protein [Halanaerobium congolense]PXV62732.1 cell division protein FtsL [Halanaerobium congolense]TDP13534.1 cell division protein FtsL [Halanaerobium congolense]SDD15141.1 Septum formation initiator [Halanaerobium congolense]SDJ21445.1 Septum formation initiator [Halanaerobium congolense]SET78371.1 Septum formation initiator [Halanaerobium congolense]
MPRQKKDFLLNPVFTAIIVIIAVIAAFNFYQNITRMTQIENKIKKIEAEIAETEAENKQLQKQIQNSDSKEYIEEVAREKLGLVKPGEKLLIPVESIKEEQGDNQGEENDNDNDN